MTFFSGKKSTTKKKAGSEELTFTLKNIDVAKIDKNFMNEMKTLETTDLIFDIDDEKGTSLEKLGISSLKKEPMTTIVEKEKIKLQTFTTMIDYTTKKRLPSKTDIPCFGCHRKFSTIPIGVPIEYHPSVYTSKNDSSRSRNITISERQELEKDDSNSIKVLEYFDTDGVVCSFNCIYSVIDDDNPLYKKTRSLVPMMYKSIFGTYPKEKILKSPSWRLREEYGGPLTDEEFVANLQTIQFTDMNQVSRVLNSMNPVGRVFKVSEVG